MSADPKGCYRDVHRPPRLHFPCSKPSSLWSVFSVVLVAAARHAGSQFPDQGLNLRPLQWKRGALTTGPLGKSLWPFLRAGPGNNMQWFNNPGHIPFSPPPFLVNTFCPHSLKEAAVLPDKASTFQAGRRRKRPVAKSVCKLRWPFFTSQILALK